MGRHMLSHGPSELQCGRHGPLHHGPLRIDAGEWRRVCAMIGWFAVVTAVPTCVAGTAAPQRPAFRVVAYLPDYRAAEFDPVAARGLTDLILFSAEPTATGQLDLSRLKEIPWARLRTFMTLERVRLILSIGGWERSMHFSSVAGSGQKRREFIKAVVTVCLEERLDGVDLDWEHPKNDAEQAGYARRAA